MGRLDLSVRRIMKALGGSERFLHLFPPPHFPILHRTDPFHLMEHPAEVVSAADSGLPADGIGGFITEPQLILGMRDPHLQQIIIDAHAELLLKYAG